MEYFPTKVVVTDHVIDVATLSDIEKEYFLKLKDRLIEIYEEKKEDRIIISLSGISGTGKSVATAIITELMKNEKHDFAFYSCGLDAFHFTNDVLEEKLLKNVKGRFDTYDTHKLKKTLEKFCSGETISFPTYSREIHNPVEDSFVVTAPKALLMIEGLWFLRNDSAWSEIRKHISYSFFIKADETLIKENVIKRHMHGGRIRIDAETFYEQSDHLNTVEILNNGVAPDEVILLYSDLK